MFDIRILDHEKVRIGFAVKSKGGTKYTRLDELPEGSTCEFVADNTTVAVITETEDGLTCYVGSGEAGTAVVDCKLHIPQGGEMPNGMDKTDVVNVTVARSAPGSAELSVGGPEEEGV